MLEQHILLGELSREELNALLAHAHARRYVAGETIFLNGSAGLGLIAVLAGTVRISTTSRDGRELLLNTISGGEVFGELALLDGKARSADAFAATDCELMLLERRHFVHALEKNPKAALRLLAILAARLRQTTEQMQDIAFLGLEHRLAKQLLHLAEHHGRLSSEGVVIGVKLSQRNLGEMVGISRESINKQLRIWHRAGIIRHHTGIITLLDAAALRAVVEVR